MPRDDDVRFWSVEPGCSVVLMGIVERDFAMVARVGATQLDRHRGVHHHLATAHARADNTFILYGALHVTMCADSHQPFIVSRSHLADAATAQLHSLGTDEYEACCREKTDATHPDVCWFALEQGSWMCFIRIA